MKKRKSIIRASEFDYYLPPQLISQKPIKPRDQARLLILDRKNKNLSHARFRQLTKILSAGDILVVNDSKVMPARLIGQKATGGKIEIFLLRPLKNRVWEALIGGKIKNRQKIFITPKIWAETINQNADHYWRIKFNADNKKILSLGQTPTPPYIKRRAKMSDYQTIYARNLGSVAAPTAGLHFTKKLIDQLKKKGIKIEKITLHVGPGTFLPVRTEYLKDHQMHREFAIISAAAARRLNQAKKSGRQIIAVGTTVVRTLEAASNSYGHLKPRRGWVDLFIYPGYQFKIVNQMITNFHLPRSTLLMLISAFAGQKLTKLAYQEAIQKKISLLQFRRCNVNQIMI